MKATLATAHLCGILAPDPVVACDSTGLQTRHISHHYAYRIGQQPYLMRRFLKLSAAIDCRSHLFVAAVTTKGPTHDVREAPRLLRQAKRNTNFSTVLLDAGYDAEYLHVLVREKLHAKAWIPPRAGRKSRKWPKAKYRREMRKSFNKDIYKQRVQIESAFSRNKRRLGAELRARKWESQKREAALRLLTHNLMLL